MCDCVEKLHKSLLKELKTDVVRFECIPTNLETKVHYFGIRFSYAEKGKMKKSFIKPIFCCMCGRKLGERLYESISM